MTPINVDTSQPWAPDFAPRTQAMQASEIRELLKVLEKPDVISFGGGIPDPELFPASAVRDAFTDALATSPGTAMQYTVSEGVGPLRRWIADHMRSLGVPCDVENILVTNGSQQGLEFLGKLFLSPGDTALVTAPTYLGALQAFSPNEPNYAELKLTDTNRTADYYRASAEADGGRCKFAYVVPDFSNPSGETIDLATRRRLLGLAAELDIAVIEDSPYTELRYDGEAVPPLQSLDVAAEGDIDQSRVIYCGSFSKIFAPGLRVGWVCARQDVIERLTLIKQSSDLCGSTVNQLVACRLAETIYDDQVETIRRLYAEKRDAMLDELDKRMPDGVTWTRPEGGFFIWVTLPKGLDAGKLLTAAVEDAGVSYVPGRAFFADRSGRNTLRLSFSMPSLDNIREGVRRLAAFIRNQS